MDLKLLSVQSIKKSIFQPGFLLVRIRFMYCQCHFLWRKLLTTQFHEIDHVKNWFPFFLNAQQQRLVDRQIYVLAMQWRKLITQFSPKAFANSIAINRLLLHYVQTKLSKWELRCRGPQTCVLGLRVARLRLNDGTKLWIFFKLCFKKKYIISHIFYSWVWTAQKYTNFRTGDITVLNFGAQSKQTCSCSMNKFWVPIAKIWACIKISDWSQ